MKELQVKVIQEPGIIKFNYTELKEQLSARMKEYEGAIFTEEYKQTAKAELANLRKLKEAMDKRRKEVKAQCMVPYTTEFEPKVKELLEIIDEPICLIDKQLKEMETERVRKRREGVGKLWGEIVEPIEGGAEFLPFETVYQKKWDLSGTSMKSIREDLISLVSKTASEVSIISNSQSDMAVEALEIYKKDRDLAKALSFINVYEANKKKALEREEEKRRQEERHRRQEEIDRALEEERRKQEEIAAAREEERRAVERAALAAAAPEGPAEPFIDGADDLPFEQPTTITAFYKVVCTSEELEQVEIAFNSFGIYFERRDA